MIVSLLALLLAAPALAYTPSGFGVPLLGGGLAGPTEAGALGVINNPAAAHADRGSWLLDVGWMYSDLYYELDLDDDFSLRARSGGLAPSLAGAEPLGPVGLGFAFVPLYARGGGEPAPDDGAQRFHSVEGLIQLLDLQASAAMKVDRAWTLGVGLHYGLFSIDSRRRIDAGAIINSVAPSADAPLGDPFLEGEQTLSDLRGTTVGSAVGIRYHPERGPKGSLSWRSGKRGQATGPLTMVPSTSLEMELQAEVTTDMPLPPSVQAAMDFTVGRVRLVPELTWIGWSSMYEYGSDLDDLEIASHDEAMQSILESYELDEADFLEGAKEAQSLTGMRDVWSPGVSVFVPLTDGWSSRLGAWWAPAAFPDEAVHPGNMDFATLDLRAALAWEASEEVTVGFSGDWFHSPERRINDSEHSLSDPDEPGSLVPSGDGEYKLALARLGVTLVVSHAALVKPRGE